MNFIFMLISACILLDRGVSGVDTDEVSVMEGDSVTLHTQVKTKHQDRIKWYYNYIRIAQINRDQSKICTDVQCNEGTERFRDRLKLDHQTGSLTITNIRTEHAGVYKLQIISGESNDRTFNVSVSGVPDAAMNKMKTVKEGESFTFDPGEIKKPNDVIMWYFNDTCIAKITGDLRYNCEDDRCDERFRDRLKLDHQTGSLTITNTRNTDCGLYELKINRDRFSIMKSFDAALIDSHVETPVLDKPSGGTAEKLVIICSLLPAMLVIYCLWRNCKRSRQKYDVDSVSVTEGESVNLKTDIKIQRGDQILWTSDEKSHIAEIKRGTKNISIKDNDDGSFRDRLKLNKRTGSLTIRDIRITDSGVYTLKITRNGKTSFKLSNVSVFVKSVSVMEGETVTLPTNVTEVQRDELLLWTFGPDSTRIAEITVVDMVFHNDALNERFKDRLKVNQQTGSLTITNTRTTDSGLYKLKISRSGNTSSKLFSVTVSGELLKPFSATDFEINTGSIN